jgi:hypothetical protein
MCSALITIFSGYGIIVDFAANLGVYYLGKLEKLQMMNWIQFFKPCSIMSFIQHGYLFFK